MPKSEIIFFSDLHLDGHGSVRADRANEEIEKALEYLLEMLEPGHEYIVLCGGDVFDTPSPSEEARLVFRRFIYNTYKKLDCITGIVSGNHDTPISTTHPLVSTSYYPMQSPQVHLAVNSDTKVITCSAAVVFAASYSAMAYTPDNVIAQLRECSKYYNQENMLPVIFLTHGMLEGIAINQKYRAKDYDISADTMEEISKYCDMVLLGDYHKPVTIKDYAVPVMYAGSILAENYGESEYTHGYWRISIDGNTERIPTIVPAFETIEDSRVIIRKKITAREDVDKISTLPVDKDRRYSLEVQIEDPQLQIAKPHWVDCFSRKHKGHVSNDTKDMNKEYRNVARTKSIEGKLRHWLTLQGIEDQKQIESVLATRRESLAESKEDINVKSIYRQDVGTDRISI
jgi:DNA repair exonuclease SbcCD nuclease subunit